MRPPPGVRPAGPRLRAQPCYLGGAKKACAIAPEPLNIYSGLQALLSRSNRLDFNLAAESFTSRRWWRWGEETGGGDRGGNQKTLNLFVVFICFGFFFFFFFSRSLLARILAKGGDIQQRRSRQQNFVPSLRLSPSSLGTHIKLSFSCVFCCCC